MALKSLEEQFGTLIKAELRRRARQEGADEEDPDEPHIDDFVDIAIKQIRGAPVEI